MEENQTEREEGKGEKCGEVWSEWINWKGKRWIDGEDKRRRDE